ncbi:carboxypeptidase-like regulatory domain-containing protein [Ancylomarina sp. DW003]|nr:carboxypeptidase-like regulatory domain-containing protein [Ancylomarina sp. DW003]MDE5422395.1 carboxypeptidase-like regulatory domain-containing protein [Ancylomarina sp. DW003]
MIKKFIFTLISLTCILGSIQAQEEEQEKTIRIIGQLTNAANQQAIPFANIGVKDTYIGAATNYDGYFELKVPGKYIEKDIQISAVGFTTYNSNIKECTAVDTLRIQLKPVNYKIGEVEVTAQSLVLIKMLKNAIDRIPDNYLQTPFNYDIYYRAEKSENNKVERKREAAIRIYDDKGYVRENAYQVFKERSYRFLQVRKNFENNSLADGSTYLDELLEMDIVRSRGNILNKNHLNFYDLKLDRVTEYENDSIWVIAYKSKKPLLSNTSDYYATSYSGKIYIKLKDFSVIKNETHVVTSNYSPQGRSFYVNPERQDWKPLKIEYDFSSTYKEHFGYYYLSYVDYKRHHELENKTSGEKKKIDTNAEMLITKIITTNPEVIENRAYYEDMEFDENFWNNYNIIFDGAE